MRTLLAGWGRSQCEDKTVNEKTDRPKLELSHAPVEIERKFLVANDEWKRSTV
jgi:hypothetical protein